MTDANPPRVSPGSALRHLREARGLTLEAVSEATHVKVRYLQALEQEDIGALLGPAYAKSFLKAYARFLEAPPEVVEAYGVLLAPPPESPEPGPQKREGSGSCVLVLLVLVLVAIGVYAVTRGRHAVRGPTGEAPPDTSAPYLEASGAPDTLPLLGGQPMLSADTLSSLQIIALDSTWVEVSADGQSRLHELLMPGEVRIVEAGSEFRLTLGNAGGVELTLNGERLPSPGARGMVVRNMVIDARRAVPEP